MSEEKTSSYVLTLKLKTNDRDENILDKRFELCRKLYNAVLGNGLKRFNTLKERKCYVKIRKELSEINKQFFNCKDKKKLKLIAKQRKSKYKELTDLLNEFGINEYSLINDMTPMRLPFNDNIDNKTAQALSSRAWKSLNKLIFGDAKMVSFKKQGELYSVEGKWNKSGITYRDGIIKWNGLKLPIVIKKKDRYAKEALQDRVKYCRIKREMIKGKYYYYIQLVLEGIPPIKYDEKTGEIKRQIGKGKVGIDIGTRTIAYSSEQNVKLLELSPKTNGIDKELKLIQRKMDRSRRSTNQNKYNENGTIKRGNKDKWIKSKRYIKLVNHRKELFRKQSEIRKQEHNQLANELIQQGNEFYVEAMNFKGLQKRAKKTTKNKNGKFNKKKRFGKSLKNKAPAMLLSILNNKLIWCNTKLYKIDTTKVKASQYNPITDEYNKKKLSERWNIFTYNNEEVKIQRDIMSAYVIMYVNDDLETVNRQMCLDNYERFKELHDEEIERIKNCNTKIIGSMGIH